MTTTPETAVIAAIASHSGLLESTITPETRFREDLQADAFDLTMILISIEDDTGVDLLSLDTDDLKTVADLITAYKTAASSSPKATS